MGTEIVKAHVFIEGKVQGVFYRSWMKGLAENLELVGWVKNLEDGRVEAMIQGSKEKVEEMMQKCREGSVTAKVSHVDVSFEDPEEGFVAFSILG